MVCVDIVAYYCGNNLLLKLKPAYILLPVAAFIAISLFAQKTAAGFLNYLIKSVAISFEGITPVLKIDVMVQNPSNQQFVIRSISGDALANDQVIGTFSMFQQVIISPNSQIALPVIVRLNPLAIVSDLVTLILRGSGISQVIKLKGYVNANNIVAPLELSYKVI